MLCYRIGDVLDSDCDVICHQVNCQGVMGAGLAKQVRAKFPTVFSRYVEACKNTPHTHLLGKAQFVPIHDSPRRYVCNVFGQYRFGTDRRHTDYDALKKALSCVNRRCAGRSIAIPYKMGCALGGGDWTVVSGIIEECLTDCTVYIYIRA
jgi:O-acetyl-ADP-ribose deacetylase (regulator of RNase III)